MSFSALRNAVIRAIDVFSLHLISQSLQVPNKGLINPMLDNVRYVFHSHKFRGNLSNQSSESIKQWPFSIIANIPPVRICGERLAWGTSCQ